MDHYLFTPAFAFPQQEDQCQQLQPSPQQNQTMAPSMMTPSTTTPKKFDYLANSFVRQNVTAGMAMSTIIGNDHDVLANKNHNSPSSLVSDLDRVLDILDSAEGIVAAGAASREAEPMIAQVTPSNGGSYATSNNKNTVNNKRGASMMSDLLCLEPTPLGPEGVQVLVRELPLTASMMSTSTSTYEKEQEAQEDLLEVLNPLLMFGGSSPPPTKRQRLSVTAPELPCSSSSGTRPIDAASCPDHKLGATSSATTTSPATAPSPPDLSDTPDEERFRPYQADQWKDRFQDLEDFREQKGHCLVPHNFPENQQLAQWIKRQRYQYKLKQLNRHSTLTDERQAALEEMGFVWDSHKAAWIERFQSLQTFRSLHGHCNVPSNYTDRSLAIWVKCQRRQFKLFRQGARSTMNQERFSQLEVLGFDWNPRNL
eukprot:CAMPEP_0117076030 /NCGR_PEP_ID=MMETSP0472-20121206/53607_1 /TAXON_ID=693140 ORGANISM="Tiarina fusus, Strain LIS" /NCGR_SAMPLE_ID=MMETSP0472 /ASSEMBLY_ACC=CAM_ASM_000603 /LENGTH=425 /DNA_ID=CAMNT_0004801785 /DNA_START=32 /DNA_END=1310 /DNA_ORIENTATION=-